MTKAKEIQGNSFIARKAMSAVCAAGIIIALSACGVNGGNAQVESSTPSSTVTPAVSTGTGMKAGDLINGLPTKKELANDGKGDYIQTTVSDDDPALTYNKAIVGQTVLSSYKESEITDLQKQFVTFVAEEGIDSTLNDNPTDGATQEAWWNKNKGRFDPSYQAELHSDLKSNDPNKPLVFRGQFRQAGNTKYSLLHGADKTHVHSRKITPTLIKVGTLDGRQAIRIQADVEFVLNANLKDKTVLETTKGTVSYTYAKDAASGKWLITGFSSKYTTTPVAG